MTGRKKAPTKEMQERVELRAKLTQALFDIEATEEKLVKLTDYYKGEVIKRDSKIQILLDQAQESIKATRELERSFEKLMSALVFLSKS